MKQRVILIMLLVLSGGPAYAEWVRLTEDEVMTVHFDPDTIRRKGNVVKIWLLYDYKTALAEGRDAIFSAKMQSEYDCTEELVRTIAISQYAGNMGKGKVVTINSGDGPWSPVVPGTLGQREWKLACVKK